MTLLERFKAHVASVELGGGRVLVAVSGGPDSLVLLDLLVQSQAQHGLELVVAHLDHGINPESGRVAERVRSLAASYHLPVELEHLSLGPTASETVARERRYRWLESTRTRIGARFVFTAHHADDQVETVLMRVLAGSGPAGLSGMAPRQGTLVRPLLPFRRLELEEHLQSSGLLPWVDPANSDPRHLRSWIRTELLPALRARLPEAESNLERLARQAAADRAAWDAVLDTLPGLDLRREPDGISVAASPLEDYDSALIQATILALARRVGCPLGPARASRVLSLLCGGSSGNRVPLGEHWTAELTFGRLRMSRVADDQPFPPWSLAGLQGAGVWGRWQFRWEKATAPERQDRTGWTAWFLLDDIMVRAWAPGDKLKPLGGSGRRLVVRCFQEARVPRSSRGSWPVLAHSGEILWVPGVCRSDARVPAGGVEALRVDAQYA
jgi:tRNA(Ile)-lysidine synthase